MRWFRRPVGLSSLAAGCLLIFVVRAGALEEWLQHAVAGSPVEAALYRAMALPGVEVLFPRLPRESASELSKLIADGTPEAGLYRLRALQEERALDFAAAEADWKTFAGSGHSAGMLALADFYHRRMDVQQEYATLLAIAGAPDDVLTQPTARPSWQAFERALALAADQAFADKTVSDLWQRWIARYPAQPSVYGRAFTWQLDHGDSSDAQKVVGQYRAASPHDEVFPIKSAALLALHSGGPESQQRALAVYDAAFQPLWPADLMQSYFDLLEATHQSRHFLSNATERVARNPDDLNAAVRLFYYHRQHGQPEEGLATLDAYQQSKDERKAAWTADELYTLAQLTASAQAYTDTARYDFALAHAGGTIPGGRSAAEAGLSGMVDVLLTAPDQPISLGAGNLSMYRDIGTLDQGPGYWNGILSLWFNGQSPANEFAQEEQKAQPYFHRAKARELLALLDHDDPAAPMRDALHARLLDAYAEYGDNAAVVHEGTAFLADFPKSGLRVSVALSLADAYARQNDAASEFALYDRLLIELGQQAQKMPLTAAAAGNAPPTVSLPVRDTDQQEPNQPDTGTFAPAVSAKAPAAFLLDTQPPHLAPNPSATAYAEVLDRYLGRLTAMHQLPQALAVLRKELDRNPDDPALYEKLAGFLEQNNLSAQQEEVYRRAIQKFPSGGWYDKLARFYLREQRLRDFAQLSRQVTDIFSGTELDAYFGLMHSSGSELFLQLNLYAHKRFPHDLVFTQNLLDAYSSGPTRDYAKGQALLRQTWWQSPELTQRFFELLSYSGKLDAELAQLGSKPANPAAEEELGEAELWRSHFEQAAPEFTALAASYPADEQIGQTAADLERSLAWLDPAGPQADIAAAVAIEQRLLSTNPGDLDRLARIGDILADHADASAASLASAAVFWRRMPEVAPGRQDNYLQAATVFWDYFQFDDALREIDQARTHFHEPALFGYEAGAIAEGKRDEALAVREYVRAALAKEGDASTGRLLQLARRPATATLVDAATALGPDAGIAAVRLRVAVLAAQHRSTESAPLLLAAIAHATTADQAGELAAYAQTLGLTLVRESALAREADLTQDPVQGLELRYELARLYENRGDLAEATRLIDATYKENPRLLGVVRSTVDFDWRSRRQAQAIAVLLEAAHAAQPELSRQLTAEAASKANESGDHQQARQLAESLLAQDPYDPQYIALTADSYSGDDAGLASFYSDRLQAVRSAAMSDDDRKARTALLRKGLIPALTRGGNYPAAVEQYIALISAYPEDGSLVDEAALYALRYDRQKQLLDFFGATNQASPRDSRFFIDLAEAQAVFGDPAAAIDAYARAIAIRKDRGDLYTAKAALEETLGRFDDAAADYSRLYQLSYKDPQWMIATARVRARQGRAAEAVTALEAAYLRGTQSLPRDYFRVASQLEAWNLLDEARRYAEQGAKAAGDDFLAGDSQAVGADDPATYARILTRLRQTTDALTTLRAGLAAADVAPSPAEVVDQVWSQGVAAVTEAEWRRQRVDQRRQQAGSRFSAALEAMSTAVDLYYPPEEKAVYASTLTHQRQGASSQDLAERWIPAAHTGGLAALEAGWRKELLLQASAGIEPQAQPYSALERARLLFTELGQTFETLLRRLPASSPARPDAVQQADEAYRASGDFRAEIRVLRPENRKNGDILRDRYLDLLLHHDPAALVAFAGAANESLADQAANVALAGGSPSVALAAIKARGQALAPVWGSSYSALAGLYLRDTGAGTGAAFEQALRLEATVGDRVGARPDLNGQLTGATWFYDAARYGQWRTLTPSADAEEVLAADLEGSAVARNYVTLADTYAEAGNTPAALAELDHALELDPGSAAIYDAKAVLLCRAGRKPEAVSAWQAALSALRAQEDRGHPDESFWTMFRQIARRVKDRGLFAQLKPQMDNVLRIYIRRNGNYRSTELLQAAYESAPDPAAGMDWLLSLATAASDPFYVFRDLDSVPWLPPAAKETLLLQELQLIRNTPSDSNNSQAEDWRLQASESALLNLYLQQEQNAQAQALLDSLTPAQRAMPEFAAAAILVAGRTGSMERLLASYRGRPDGGPDAKTLESVAAKLQSEKRLQPARALLEFAFSRGQSTHSLLATEYLALAEIRLQTGDTAGAVSVLEALSRTEGDTYANLDSAAALLEKNDHPAEAIPFLTTLTHSVLWELSYAVRLAEAQQQAHRPDPSALVSVARNPLAPYALRTRAALDLAQAGGQATDLGSAELSLLASAKVPATASRQPYFVTARAVAAAQVDDPHLRAQLLGEALAIAPSGSDAPAQRLALFRAQFAASDMIAARASLDVISETGASGVLNDADNSARQQTLLDSQVAAVYLATGARDMALGWLRDEVKALAPGAEASAVERRITALEAAARTEAANATRRPLIRTALDQPGIVRSRLSSADEETAIEPATGEEP